jgi:predicted RecA/RadA family phage recombinase
MTKAQFIHDGEVIDYTPTADVAAGNVVVLGDLVGVTKRDIKANTLGGLATVGVFDFTKASAEVITAGSTLYWNEEDQEATATEGTNKLLGKAVAAAGAGTAVVRGLLTR